MLRTLIITFLAVIGLTACESGEGKTGPEAPAGGFTPRVDSSKLIYVLPVEGVNGSARLVLADAIAASLRDARSPAILSDKANAMGPTIAGHVVAEERGSVVWVTASWELRAPFGTAVAEYRHQVVVDSRLWKSGSAEVINLLVSDAGPRITGMVRDFVSPMEAAASVPTPAPPATTTAPPAAVLRPLVSKPETQPRRTPVKAPPITVAALPPVTEKPGAPSQAKKPVVKPKKPRILKKIPPPEKKSASLAKKSKKPVLMPVSEKGPRPIVAQPPPVTWGRPSFLIKPVQGAPGDGNEALTKAMKEALRKRDLTVTEDPRQAGYVIEGRVEISAPVGGRQQAKIVWAVNTMAGDEVGKAVQENAVKAGSLNGAWGRVATIVTNAAVAGIQELFGIEGNRSSRTTKQPKFTGGPALPQVPGRAMPPPK